jgi:two-component system, OmpR family, aerobic respiration control sensor histidine kinase ArcB
LSAGDTQKLEKKLKLLEQQLKELQAEYQEVAESEKKHRIYLNNILKAKLPVTLYWEDKQGILLGCNDMQTTLFGLESPEAAIGKDIYYFGEMLGWAPGVAHAIHEADQNVIKTGRLLVQEEEVTIGGKRKVFLSYKTPLLDDKGESIGLFGFSADITDRKDAELLLKDAKEKAEAISSAKTEFIRNMSHDLRTPLTGIIGMAEIIGQDPVEAITKEGAKDIYQAGIALLNLLNEIIETAQLESGDQKQKKACFTLKSTIETLISMFKPALKQKHLKLETFYDDNIPAVLFGEELLFHRIILNLLGNALKFTEKGSISLEVSLLQKRADKVSLKIVVKDTGIGIAKNKQDMIFGKFSRLSPAYENHYKGSGLGLYMVKQFIDKLGGDIKVDSVLGKGTQFTCTVQFKIATAAQLKKYKPEQQQTIAYPALTPVNLQKNMVDKNISNASVLLVEDNELVQKTTLFNLKSWGYDGIDVASNGASALEKLAQKKYDLIYLDLGLPDVDGRALAKTIRSNKQSPNYQSAIVALTAHGDDEIKQECLKLGMNQVLIKPLLEKDAKKIASEFLKKSQSDVIIDQALWQNRCADNPVLVKESKQMMLQALPDIKTVSGQLLKKKQYPELHVMIYRCLNDLKYCGLPRLENATILFEKALHDKNYPALKDLHETFCHEIEEVLASL